MSGGWIGSDPDDAGPALPVSGIVNIPKSDPQPATDPNQPAGNNPWHVDGPPIPVEEARNPWHVTGAPVPLAQAISRPHHDPQKPVLENTVGLFSRARDVLFGHDPEDANDPDQRHVAGILPAVEEGYHEFRGDNGPSWGALGAALPKQLEAHVENLAGGAQQGYGGSQTRTAERTVAALNVLPQVAARTPGQGEAQMEAMAKDPTVQKTARGIGIDPKELAAQWAQYSWMKPEQQQREMLAAQQEMARGQANDVAGQSKRDAAWATERVWQPRDLLNPDAKLNPWTLKGLAFNSAVALPDMLAISAASIAGGAAGGPVGAAAAGGAVSAAVMAPQQYGHARDVTDSQIQQMRAGAQQARDQGNERSAAALSAQADELSKNADRIASTYAMLSSFAGVAGSLPVGQVLARTPAGTAILNRIVGSKLAPTFGGKVAGAMLANGAGASVQAALQHGIDTGILHETTPLKDALADIGQAGLIGAITMFPIAYGHAMVDRMVANARAPAQNEAAAAELGAQAEAFRADYMRQRQEYMDAQARSQAEAEARARQQQRQNQPGRTKAERNFDTATQSGTDFSDLDEALAKAQAGKQQQAGAQGQSNAQGGARAAPEGPEAPRQGFKAKQDAAFKAAAGATQRSDVTMQERDGEHHIVVAGKSVASFASKANAQATLAQARKLVGTAPPAVESGQSTRPAAEPVSAATSQTVSISSKEGKGEEAGPATGAPTTHPVTGLPDERAYQAADKKPVQVVLRTGDLEVARNLGDDGHRVLKAIASAAPGAYHLDNDDFVLQADSHEDASRQVGEVRQALSDHEFGYKMPDGHMQYVQGVDLDHGVGETLQAARKSLEPAASSDGEAGGAGRETGVGSAEKPEASAQDVGVKKGSQSWHGMGINIENLPGEARRGKDTNGKPFTRVMATPYGEIRGTEGADGDRVDLVMGPHPESKQTYVIDQLDANGKRFDEHKVIGGVNSEAEARKVYLSNYPKGWKGIGAVTPMSTDALKHWLAHGNTKKPLAWRPGGKKNHADTRFIQHGHELAALARKAGWAEIGGRMVRATDDFSSPEWNEVTGRTTWVPHESWFKTLQANAGLKGNVHGTATENAVAKAVKGKPLGEQQQRHVQMLLDIAEVKRLAGEKFDHMPLDELEAHLARLHDIAQGMGGGVAEEFKLTGGYMPSKPKAKAPTSQPDLFGNRSDIANEIERVKAAIAKKQAAAPPVESGATPDLFNSGSKQTDIEDEARAAPETKQPDESNFVEAFERAADGDSVKEKRRAYNDKQLTLDFGNGPEKVTTKFETRPDATPAELAIGKAFLENVLSYGDRGAGARVLANHIVREFIDRGHVKLIGQHVPDRHALATLAQVYRHPKVETFRIIFTKNNVVVDQRGYSTRMPASVSFTDKMPLDKEIEAWRRVMADTGADGYWMLHNHPSGNPRPSAGIFADQGITIRIAHELPGFQGHVVVDHNAYGHLDARGNITVHQGEFGGYIPGKNPTLDHPLLGQEITSTTELAKLAAHAQRVIEATGGLNKHTAIVIATDRQDRVAVITEMPMAMLESDRSWKDRDIEGKLAGRNSWQGRVARIRRIKSAGGAGGRVFAIVHDPMRLLWAYGDGSFDDVIAFKSTAPTLADRYRKYGTAIGKIERERVAVREERTEYGKPFYSALSKAVLDAKRDKGTGAEWMGTLKNMPGVKQEELEWTGLEDWLRGRGRVSREEVADYMRAHEIEVGEVMHADSDSLRYAEHSLRGGHAPRELLLTLPSKPGVPDFKGGHWAEPNVVAHIRFDERASASPMPNLMHSGGSESGAHGFAADSELLSDVAKRPSLYAHGLRGLDVDVRKAVESSVVSAISDEQIRRAVISSVPVDVVHDLARFELTPEQFLSDHTMLAHSLSGDPDADVRLSAGAEAALVRTVAGFAAERVAMSPDLSGPSGNDLSAPSAGNVHRTLHIAEFQSDLHQKGRKYGYGAQTDKIPELQHKILDMQEGVRAIMRRNDNLGFDHSFDAMQAIIDHDDWRNRWQMSDTDAQAIQPWIDTFKELRGAQEKVRYAVPDAPFKTTWAELALKRMIRFAAEHGYDRLSWDTGDTNADRYRLDEQSANGMREFYDKILPAAANKILKRMGGGRVKLSGVRTDGLPPNIVELASRTPDHPAMKRRPAPAHSIDITPDIAAHVMRGQALFEPQKPYGTASERPEEPPPPHQTQLALNAIGGGDWGGLKRFMSPANMDVYSKETASIARAALGELAQATHQAQQHLDAFSKQFDLLPIQDRLDFMHAMETGAKQPHQKLQPAADTIRKLLDEWRDRVIGLDVGALSNWIENYFPHIWADPDNAKRVLGAIAGRRPLRGPASFLKQRVIPTIKEGMDLGLKPLSTNPLILTLLKLREMQRFVTGTKLMQQLKAAKLAVFAPANKPIPPDFRPIEDAVGRVLQWSEDEGGFVIRGKYVMPENAAHVINNHLSASALQGFTATDLIRRATSVVSSLQLGFSAFHLGFTTLDAVISKNALAIERMLRGEPLRAAQALLEMPVAAPMNLARGMALMKAYSNPGGATPLMQRVVQGLVAGGGRVKMDRYFQAAQGISPFTGVGFRSLAHEIRAALQMPHGKFAAIAKAMTTFPAQYSVRLWRDLQDIGRTMPAWEAPFEVAGRIVHASSALIMEHIVPLQKLGVFSDLAQDYFRTHPDATPEETVRAMQSIWDSVDNRLGEMVYDNLFWHRTYKDILHLGVRAVGWNLGTFREIGGAPTDVVRLLEALRKGNVGLGKGGKPTDPFLRRFADQVGHRIPYVLAMTGTTMMLGAMLQWLLTGKGPDEFKDYFFPKTGRLTKYGTPERISLPSYIKDIYEYSKHPGQTVINKANPLIGLMASIYQNRDFYGDAIRNPDAPWYEQLKESAQYAAREVLPFSIQGAKQFAGANDNGARGAALTVAPFVGLTPAPAMVTSPEMMARFEHSAEQQAYIKGLNRQLRAAQEKGDAAEVKRLREELRQEKLNERRTQHDIKQERARGRSAKAHEISELLQGKGLHQAADAAEGHGYPALAALLRSLPETPKPRVAAALEDFA